MKTIHVHSFSMSGKARKASTLFEKHLQSAVIQLAVLLKRNFTYALISGNFLSSFSFEFLWEVWTKGLHSDTSLSKSEKLSNKTLIKLESPKENTYTTILSQEHRKSLPYDLTRAGPQEWHFPRNFQIFFQDSHSAFNINISKRLILKNLYLFNPSFMKQVTTNVSRNRHWELLCKKEVIYFANVHITHFGWSF